MVLGNHLHSVNTIGLVRLRTLAFNRAYGSTDHSILVMYPAEHLVIGPANHAYFWVAFAKEHCTEMVLLISSPMPQRGSRKCGTLGTWFSEPPNKELGCFMPWTRVLTTFTKNLGLVDCGVMSSNNFNTVKSLP